MKLFVLLMAAFAVVVPSTLLGQVTGQAQVAEPELTVEETLGELERVHQNHINVLADLYHKVPVQAQTGIQRAIENSQRGLERVKVAKAKHRDKVRGGRPDGVGNGQARAGGPQQGGTQARGGRPDGVGQGSGQARAGGPQQGGTQARGGRPDGVGQGSGQARAGGPQQGGAQARGGRPDWAGKGGRSKR